MATTDNFSLRLDAQTISFKVPLGFYRETYFASSTVLSAGAPVVKDLAIAYDPARGLIGVKRITR
jgi:hypothetical protein